MAVVNAAESYSKLSQKYPEAWKDSLGLQDDMRAQRAVGDRCSNVKCMGQGLLLKTPSVSVSCKIEGA